MFCKQTNQCREISHETGKQSYVYELYPGTVLKKKKNQERSVVVVHLRYVVFACFNVYKSRKLDRNFFLLNLILMRVMM